MDVAAIFCLTSDTEAQFSLTNLGFKPAFVVDLHWTEMILNSSM
ncbi:MAG: hypothetical protein QW828_01780 [Candidatus Bathyarchaeia archaeon]